MAGRAMFYPVAPVIQISFQPAFDPFHTMFRLMRLFHIIKQHGPLDYDQVRILDFFLLFPTRIDAIRMMQPHVRFRSLAAKYERSRPYGEQPDDQILFSRMKPIQLAAIQSLATHGFLDRTKLSLNEVSAAEKHIPKEVKARLESANHEDSELLSFLDILASKYPLLGRDGLKDRTGLLEYRYDAV